ncbi:hypothetical protein [Aquimarina aggregata]|uniref:hypothetical protein n=1 Tax=Aquimarina aggregata TaxID=1642818 RepID=UPI0024909E12|nr:hypothetical protein [Aquimarina aggregata]
MFKDKLHTSANDSHQLVTSLIQGQIDAFESKNDTTSYNRIIFLKSNNSGEAGKTTRITIRLVNDSKALISKTQNGHLETITINRFEVSEFVEKLKNAQDNEMTSSHNLLMVDFKNPNTCECLYFEDIGPKENVMIRDMSFFD